MFNISILKQIKLFQLLICIKEVNKQIIQNYNQQVQKEKDHKQNQFEATSQNMSKSKIKPQPLGLTYSQYLKKNKNLSNIKFGKYVICEKLGEGAFGAVFKGMNNQTKQFIAIKVLDLQAVEQEKSQYIRKIKKRLVRTEAQMMIKCNNQHLIKCYDIFQNKSLKLMLIQYCNGGDLDAQISKNGHIPEQDAVKILKQILNGLAELHRNSIVHRDLKSENILIHDGVYKIADFGFSKQLNSNSPLNQLKQTKLGTISTMAPQIMQSNSYGLQADIWSIGVIYYNMLYGKLPFKKLSYGQILNQIKKNKIFEMKTNIIVSDESKQFIMQCLVYQSQKRLNWQNISHHKLFKKFKNAIPQTISMTMRRDFSLDVQNMKNLDSIKVQINDIDTNQNIQMIASNQLQKPVQIKPAQLQKMRDQIRGTVKSSAFSWSKAAHFQCLKTQLIIKEIIQPLQLCSKDFLENREIIEILYLLSARCFCNISFKNNEGKYQQEDVMADLMKQIQNLYKKVQAKFEQYSVKLSKKQSQALQVVKDKLFSLYKSESLKQKDNFLTGIERSQHNSSDLQSYSKQQQIQFTQKCLNEQFEIIKKQKCLTQKTLNFIKNYQKICTLTLKQVKDQYFKTYIVNNFNKE